MPVTLRLADDEQAAAAETPNGGRRERRGTGFHSRTASLFGEDFAAADFATPLKLPPPATPTAAGATEPSGGASYRQDVNGPRSLRRASSGANGAVPAVNGRQPHCGSQAGAANGCRTPRAAPPAIPDESPPPQSPEQQQALRRRGGPAAKAALAASEDLSLSQLGAAALQQDNQRTSAATQQPQPQAGSRQPDAEP